MTWGWRDFVSEVPGELQIAGLHNSEDPDLYLLSHQSPMQLLRCEINRIVRINFSPRKLYSLELCFLVNPQHCSNSLHYSSRDFRDLIIGIYYRPDLTELPRNRFVTEISARCRSMAGLLFPWLGKVDYGIKNDIMIYLFILTGLFYSLLIISSHQFVSIERDLPAEW